MIRCVLQARWFCQVIFYGFVMNRPDVHETSILDFLLHAIKVYTSWFPYQSMFLLSELSRHMRNSVVTNSPTATILTGAILLEAPGSPLICFWHEHSMILSFSYCFRLKYSFSNFQAVQLTELSAMGDLLLSWSLVYWWLRIIHRKNAKLLLWINRIVQTGLRLPHPMMILAIRLSSTRGGIGSLFSQFWCYGAFDWLGARNVCLHKLILVELTCVHHF